MKQTFVIIFLMLFSSWCLSAQPAADSVSLQFEICMKKHYDAKFSKLDSGLFCFYGSAFDLTLKKTKGDGGALVYYQLEKINKTDSVNIFGLSTVRFFDREMSYAEYLNFIIAKSNNQNCLLPKQRGVWLFLSCPEEIWGRFYFDQLLNKSKAFLTPVVDIIQSDGINVSYKREMLICEYFGAKGFEVKQVVIIDESTICK